MAAARIGEVPDALRFLAAGADGDEYGHRLGRAVRALRAEHEQVALHRGQRALRMPRKLERICA